MIKRLDSSKTTRRIQFVFCLGSAVQCMIDRPLLLLLQLSSTKGHAILVVSPDSLVEPVCQLCTSRDLDNVQHICLAGLEISLVSQCDLRERYSPLYPFLVLYLSDCPLRTSIPWHLSRKPYLTVSPVPEMIENNSQ
jgi:hypothetical protein